MARRIIVSSVLALACVCSIQTAASAASNYALDRQIPATAGFSTNTVPSSTRGWRFQVNVEDIYVTELGIFSPESNTTPLTVTLFDYATHDILAQVTTTPGMGWCFEDLAVPVALTQGSQYIVAGYFPYTPYYYGSRGSIGDSWFPTGDIQYLDMRYGNGVAASDFPTNVLTDYQYGVPDFGYQIGDGIGPAIPAPAAAVLVGLGITAVTWLRKRRAI